MNYSQLNNGMICAENLNRDHCGRHLTLKRLFENGGGSVASKLYQGAMLYSVVEIQGKDEISKDCRRKELVLFDQVSQYISYIAQNISPMHLIMGEVESA